MGHRGGSPGPGNVGSASAPPHQVFCLTGFRLRAVVTEDDKTIYTNFLNTVAWDLTSGKATVVSDQLRGYSTGFEEIRSWLPGSELTIM